MPIGTVRRKRRRTSCGRARVARSQSSAGRPRTASRTAPPTAHVSYPASSRRRAISRTARGGFSSIRLRARSRPHPLPAELLPVQLFDVEDLADECLGLRVEVEFQERTAPLDLPRLALAGDGFPPLEPCRRRGHTPQVRQRLAELEEPRR